MVPCHRTVTLCDDSGVEVNTTRTERTRSIPRLVIDVEVAERNAADGHCSGVVAVYAGSGHGVAPGCALDRKTGRSAGMFAFEFGESYGSMVRAFVISITGGFDHFTLSGTSSYVSGL